MANETKAVNLLTANDLLENWQGHRRLTRRVIEAFPEEKLFTFSLGGMRTFGEMVHELMRMSTPVVDGVRTGEWKGFEQAMPQTRAEVLALWDKQTGEMNERFPLITEERFRAVEKVFGQWEMPGLTIIVYAMDNEVHHRGEGYVYLRALGVEPPAFWERG